MTTQTQPVQNVAQSTVITHALLGKIADGIEMQNSLLQFLASELQHLREVAEAGAEASTQTAERLERAMQTLATVASVQPQGAGQAQPVGAPVAAGNYETFPATAIEFGIMAGKPTYKIKGGRYAKFGVRIWPEAMQAMGIVADSLKPGDNPLTGNVVALIGEKGPQKIVAWAN